MNIKHCKFCKKMHQGLGNLCPQCVQEMDTKYIAVRNHLDQNPNLTLHELAEVTSVDERSILFLVREGRLMLKNASADIKCIKCGAAIASGRYCAACKSGIMQSLVSSSEEPKAGQPGGGARPATGGTGDSADKIWLHTRSTKK